MRKTKIREFIRARLDTRSPYGLVLTAGVILIINYLGGFLSDIYQVIRGSRLIAAEPQIIALVQAFTPEKLYRVLFFITLLANTNVVLAVTLLSIITLFVYGKRRELLYFTITAASTLAASPLIKLIIGRKRPASALINLPSSASFPSGHALFALAIYGFLFYLLYKKTRNIALKVLLVAIALLLITSIGFSRVYLGVHFPTDVFAGWNLGMVILVTAITVYEVRAKQKPDVYQRLPLALLSPTARTAAVSLGIAAVVLTVSFEYWGAMTQSQQRSIPTSIEQFISSENLFSQDFYGQRMEPVSFLVIGSEDALLQTFERAGWHTAQKPTIPNLIKLSKAIAENAPYPDAPITPAFYDGSVNTLAFEKETDLKSSRQRHHTRYWKTRFTVSGKPLWVATASFDKGVELGSKIQIPTHKIDPNIDEEREFIANDLNSTGLVASMQKIDLVGSITGKNAAGDPFYTDGEAYVLLLAD